MSKIFTGETLVKLTLIFSFFACYTWVYQAMSRDEKVLEKLYVQRFDRMEQISTASAAVELTSD